MRITGGSARGRLLKVPAGDRVRPTQDKVRQAIFSALAARIDGARVLDLFAGSGSLGLEAWSRGAASVCWVEDDPRVHALLTGNVRALCGGDAGPHRCLRMDAARFLERPPPGVGGFDLVFADPPYDRHGGAVWLEKALRCLEAGPILAADGLLVFEQSMTQEILEPATWSLRWNRTYGETRILMYSRIATPTTSP